MTDPVHDMDWGVPDSLENLLRGDPSRENHLLGESDPEADPEAVLAVAGLLSPESGTRTSPGL